MKSGKKKLAIAETKMNRQSSRLVVKETGLNKYCNQLYLHVVYFTLLYFGPPWCGHHFRMRKKALRLPNPKAKAIVDVATIVAAADTINRIKVW